MARPDRTSCTLPRKIICDFRGSHPHLENRRHPKTVVWNFTEFVVGLQSRYPIHDLRGNQATNYEKFRLNATTRRCVLLDRGNRENCCYNCHLSAATSANKTKGESAVIFILICQLMLTWLRFWIISAWPYVPRSIAEGWNSSNSSLHFEVSLQTHLFLKSEMKCIY